jgi:hypothetical protein
MDKKGEGKCLVLNAMTWIISTFWLQLKRILPVQQKQLAANQTALMHLPMMRSPACCNVSFQTQKP